MKKSSPWWWSKMASQQQQDYSMVTVTDYYLSDSGDLELVSEEDNRFFCGPSEDIWRKFEPLLPTPPRSPNRPCCPSDEEDSDGEVAIQRLNLTLVSDSLDSPDQPGWGLCTMPLLGLKNDLLHDCMWSGQCTDTCKRGHHTTLSSPDCLPCSLSPPASVTIKIEPSDPDDQVGVEVATSPPATLPSTSPLVYVDPCTMLPYTPLSDHSYYHPAQQQQQQQQLQPDEPIKYGQPRTPICDTPSDTEDDEIDVVTLPTPVNTLHIKAEPEETLTPTFCGNKSRKTPHTRKRYFAIASLPTATPPALTVPPLRVVIPAGSLAPKRQYKERRSAGRKRFQKRRSNASSNGSSGAGGWVRRHYNKRRFPPPHHKHLNTVQPQQTRTFSCSSDSEDCVEKRSMHNSMERKRRDDLRYAFQTLREHVPELASNPKAPKVLILNRAASYARLLNQTGQALEKTLKQETKKRLELQRKLIQLSKLK